MMDIAEDVVVAVPPDSVWPILSDPSAVVSCIPGAQLIDMDGDNFNAKITVKFGPMKVAFTGKGILEFDAATHTGQLSGQGGDGRGTTKVRASGRFRILPENEGLSSRISVRGEVVISGSLAGVIERGARHVISQITLEFATALAERCSGGEEDENSSNTPVQLSLFRTSGRPDPRSEGIGSD